MPRYFNLPRIEFTTLDGQLIALNSVPLTESVLVVGPALDGPTDRVVRINNAQEVERIFGPVVFTSEYSGPSGQTAGYSGNAAMKAVREVQAGGCADIRVMRVGGSLATGTYTMPAVLNAGASGTLTLAGKFNGRIYNQATVTFTSGATGGTVVIGQPTSKGGPLTLNYSGFSSGATIATVVDQINSHPQNRTVRLTIGTLSATAPARLLTGAGTLAGGTDGTIYDDNATNKVKMYADLTDTTSGTFVLLQDTEVDNVCLVGIYLDDMVVSGNATKSVATDFANFLGQRTVDSPMLGILGVKPLDDASSRAKITTHYNALISPTAAFRAANWTTAGYFMNNGFVYSDGSLEQPIDAGAYLQVVAGDVIINDPNLGLYTESAAGIYAGKISSLKPHQATTQQRIDGIYTLPYEFTRAQLDTLVGGVGRDTTLGLAGQGAYTTVRRIQNRGMMFTIDVTAANRTSDFKNLQPLRIANSVHKAVKDIGFSFLGKENSKAMRNALQTAISTFLDGLNTAGALLGGEGIGYVLSIDGGDDPQSRLLGSLAISIMLRPNFEIKSIQVRVRLSL